MSPLSLRRYRAERLLAREFEALQGRVTATVSARLRACGASLDPGDLEACYATAWQGLYAATLEGAEIESPHAWLVLVTFRRAIEQHRSAMRVRRLGRRLHGWADGGELADEQVAAEERDLAAELEDRVRLRQLFEGLRGRLSDREREAAVLCYLQGLTRAEAAERMGVSEARMRKLMEGGGPGRPGVAGKVGALVGAISDGAWCEQQGSLMRGLAFGILDPEGERYRLARLHRGECPACRAYVASLRGLAGALPPTLLPWGLGAGMLAQLTEGAHGAAAVAGAGSAGTVAGAQLGRGVGGAIGASAGAGGAAGGGWMLVGPLGTKLAVGCVLALGVGAGCVALGEGGRARPPLARRSARTHRPPAVAAASGGAISAGSAGLPAAGSAAAGATAVAHTTPLRTAALTPTARASREFGPEQAPSGAQSQSATPSLARAASTGAGSVGSGAGETTVTSAGSYEASTSHAPGSAPPAARAPSRAEREFSPG